MKSSELMAGKNHRIFKDQDKLEMLRVFIVLNGSVHHKASLQI